MEKLGKFIENTRAGFGINDLGRTAILVKRDGDIAMYQRGDGFYETGIIRKNRANTRELPDGKVIEYAERETYWTNEDIGNGVICTKDREKSEEYYEYLLGMVG